MKKNMVYQELFGCSFCAMRRLHGDEKGRTTSDKGQKNKKVIHIVILICYKGGLTTHQNRGKNGRLCLTVTLRGFLFYSSRYKVIQLLLRQCVRGPPTLSETDKTNQNQKGNYK